MAHLTEQDRAKIVSLLAERRSLRQVAIELGKTPSTVAGEDALPLGHGAGGIPADVRRDAKGTTGR